MANLLAACEWDQELRQWIRDVVSSTVQRQCQCCCRQHSFAIVPSMKLENEVVISEVNVFYNIEGSSSRAFQNWRRAIENLLRDKILLLKKYQPLHSTLQWPVACVDPFLSKL